MTKVTVTGRMMPQNAKEELPLLLQPIVASILSIHGTPEELKEADVEVDYKDYDPCSMTAGFDCAISISADLCPERSGREQEYAEKIAEGIREVFPVRHRRCYVTVKLDPASFAKFMS